VGTRLPSERELAQQFGVSRTTVREALRVLQGEGLVEVRRGRTGGSVVVSPRSSREEIARHMSRRLAEIEVVVGFRLIVEPAAARLAADRRTRGDVSRLRGLVAALDELVAEPDGAPSRFFALDSEYHRGIAENELHRELFQAVDAGDAAAAESTMRRHIGLTRDAKYELAGEPRR
jgi:DNA-binding FadR family transcriptional regulator